MVGFEDEDRAQIHRATFEEAFGIHTYQVVPANPAPLERRQHRSSNFTLFTKLPAELRRLVWRASLPPPRVFTISGGDIITLGKAAKAPLKVSNSCGAVPQQLHLCRESRREAKRYYKNLFAGHLSLRGIWIDCNFDALHFKSEQTLLEFLGSCRAAPFRSQLSKGISTNKPTAEIAAVLADLRFLAVGAERGSYAKAAEDMLSFRNLEVVVLENTDLSTSPSHRRQRRAQLERKWKGERIEQAEKTGVANKVPRICWMAASKIRGLEEDGFPEWD